ncbi:hypothetical protein L218DRAFT_1009041 [Marasmius fiardii PR-910]|nr:hypothetical protein L218DRAFT_1009041 [Marasmius fiardii PR-910]
MTPTASPDNGKQDTVGDGYDITATVTAANGTQILIHSFAYYIENAINAVAAKGGISIVSSLTPHNPFASAFADGGRSQTYAQRIGTPKKIVYIDPLLVRPSSFQRSRRS